MFICVSVDQSEFTIASRFNADGTQTNTNVTNTIPALANTRCTSQAVRTPSKANFTCTANNTAWTNYQNLLLLLIPKSKHSRCSQLVHSEPHTQNFDTAPSVNKMPWAPHRCSHALFAERQRHQNARHRETCTVLGSGSKRQR